MACEQCSARMVFHRKIGKMRCHHCGDSRPPPQSCPQCGNTHLTTLGSGTQRVENFLAEYFPKARLMRLDSDTVSSRNAFEEAAQSIREGAVDIVLGTQMISKGHDFHGITLVVVLDADQSLYSNDLRAQERLFAQLVQVSGRAGRGSNAGRVLIQTLAADAPLFGHIARQDYVAFATEELGARKLAGFPPFVHQALLKATATDPKTAEDFLKEAARIATDLMPQGITLFDPVPALMGKLSGKWRFHLLVQARERARLQSFLAHWHREIFTIKARDVSWVMDVDPLEF
jgi:primosomal protein N' (replication factor Y)